MEAEAREWIEAVLGEPLASGSFQEALKSGIALCKLVRTIQPDIIGPPSTMSAPFKQMENIGNYLSACTKLGLQAHDSFQTVDLYEGKNMVAVIGQLHRLGSLASARGFAGPSLGVKDATANKREFTEQQVRDPLVPPPKLPDLPPHAPACARVLSCKRPRVCRPSWARGPTAPRARR